MRLFKVYYPIRTVILVLGEAVLAWTSLLLGFVWQFREDSYKALNFQYGYYKIFALTLLVLLLAHWFDLYNPVQSGARSELYFRLLLIPGLLALGLAGAEAMFPKVRMGNLSFAWGLLILTAALLGWRNAYSWLAQLPYLRERVYVLGNGERAQKVVRGLQ